MTYSINLKLVDGIIKNAEKGLYFSTGKEKGVLTTPRAVSHLTKVSPFCYSEVIDQYQVYVLVAKDGKAAEVVYHQATEIGCHINWMIGWGNAPEIDILNGPTVRESDITYKEYVVDNRRTLYVGFDATKVFSMFMLSSDLGVKGACGGNLHMDDGSVVNITGAWSSRSSVVNMFLPEEDHVVECHMTGQYLRCAVRVSWLRDHLPKDTYLRKEIDKDGEIKYTVWPVEGGEAWKMLLEKKPELCHSNWIKRA